MLTVLLCTHQNYKSVKVCLAGKWAGVRKWAWPQFSRALTRPLIVSLHFYLRGCHMSVAQVAYRFCLKKQGGKFCLPNLHSRLAFQFSCALYLMFQLKQMMDCRHMHVEIALPLLGSCMKSYG